MTPVTDLTGVHIRLSSDLHDRMRELAFRRRVSARRLYEEAVLAYLRKEGVERRTGDGRPQV